MANPDRLQRRCTLVAIETKMNANLSESYNHKSERMRLQSHELETWVQLVTPTVKRAFFDAA